MMAQLSFTGDSLMTPHHSSKKMMQSVLSQSDFLHFKIMPSHEKEEGIGLRTNAKKEESDHTDSTADGARC